MHFATEFWLSRLCFQRALGGIYLIAFLIAANQFIPLLGARGLQPVRLFVHHVPFRRAPSLFYINCSDRFFAVMIWCGVGLSCFALTGFSESFGLGVSMMTWALLWIIYLSLVNVGQTFYGFGWETMLAETGFLAIVLVSLDQRPPVIVMWLIVWVLFRTMFGAGMIKVRADPCWRELTCLFYHYETQPLPNPLSWYFHHLPKFMHRWSVLFSHLVQLIVPFGLFAPQPFASIAGGLAIFHQLWLIISGNYSWLNWLTVVLGVSAFSDSSLVRVIPVTAFRTMPCPPLLNGLLYAIGGATIVLSIRPVLNLFSKNQLMNYSYNRFHLVNTYGAFGRVTRERYEIVIEGTDEPVITHQTRWQEYGFKAKPGDPRRMPLQIAPYHLRLDWLMWFLPFSVIMVEGRIQVSGYEVWFLRLIQKLLENDAQTLNLFRHNPFESKRPTFIRAGFYLYRYTDWD